MIGIRSAIWQALKKRGVDPKPLDPWYFPRVEEHTRVSCALRLSRRKLIPLRFSSSAQKALNLSLSPFTLAQPVCPPLSTAGSKPLPVAPSLRRSPIQRPKRS